MFMSHIPGGIALFWIKGLRDEIGTANCVATVSVVVLLSVVIAIVCWADNKFAVSPSVAAFAVPGGVGRVLTVPPFGTYVLACGFVNVVPVTIAFNCVGVKYGGYPVLVSL